VEQGRSSLAFQVGREVCSEVSQAGQLRSQLQVWPVEQHGQDGLRGSSDVSALQELCSLLKDMTGASNAWRNTAEKNTRDTEPLLVQAGEGWGTWVAQALLITCCAKNTLPW
jgi:hypothetical protein